MASVSVFSNSSAFPLIRLPKIRRSPLVCRAVFPLCDFLAVVSSASVVLAAAHSVSGDPLLSRLLLHHYFALWPILLVFPAIFTAFNLYPGIIHNAVTELRRVGMALTVSFLILTAVLFFNSVVCSRRILFFWWVSAVLVTPMLRSLVRVLVSHQRWWGLPVAVFFTGQESAEMVRELEAHPEIGLRPVVVLQTPQASGTRPHLPAVDVSFAAQIRASGVERAVITLPDVGGKQLLRELENFTAIFPRLMILHSSAALYSLTVDARQVGTGLAFEVRRDMLLPLPRLAKRCMDLLIVLFVAPTASLLIFLIAILVKLESPGPAFYGHRRIGKSHSSFRTWKIRTMQMNGDEVLKEALASDPALREEWLRDRKLKRDPRITRVGKFLRKTSLDELPQLWNVVCGEMSLVGPRPIVEEEIANYGQDFGLYCRVTPGLTGLWQVSGRNMVGLRERVQLDSYYVRNWSPWLDLHILARTAKVVFTGLGAF